MTDTKDHQAIRLMVMTISLENGAPLPMKMALSIINIVLPLSNKRIISMYYRDDVSQSSCELFLSFFNENIIIFFLRKKKST